MVSKIIVVRTGGHNINVSNLFVWKNAYSNISVEKYHNIFSSNDETSQELLLLYRLREAYDYNTQVSYT